MLDTGSKWGTKQSGEQGLDGMESEAEGARLLGECPNKFPVVQNNNSDRCDMMIQQGQRPHSPSVTDSASYARLGAALSCAL